MAQLKHTFLKLEKLSGVQKEETDDNVSLAKEIMSSTKNGQRIQLSKEHLMTHDSEGSAESQLQQIHGPIG